jgi:hypothetical protein
MTKMFYYSLSSNPISSSLEPLHGLSLNSLLSGHTKQAYLYNSKLSPPQHGFPTRKLDIASRDEAFDAGLGFEPGLPRSCGRLT